MKSNYQPWEINIDDFYKITDEREKFKFLLNFAVLAPSAHNSQPWKFKIGDNKIEVFLAEERRLLEGDKSNRQAYISIGCAIENIIIAAEYFGFKNNVSFIKSLGKEGSVIINFSQLFNQDNNKNHLIHYIQNRCTNRGKFKNNLPILIKFLEEINKFSSEEFNIFTITETEKSKKDLITDVVIEAQVKSMDSKNFREELSHHLKSNFTKAKVGMPGFTLGIPGPVSLFVPSLIKKFNMSQKSKKQDENLLKQYTPVFVVIGSSQDDFEGWIKVGRILERVWLMAERERLVCAPLAAIIETGEYYKKLQELLKTNMRPQVFFRMGHVEKKVRHSPRLDSGSVLIS